MCWNLDGASRRRGSRAIFRERPRLEEPGSVKFLAWARYASFESSTFRGPSSSSSQHVVRALGCSNAATTACSSIWIAFEQLDSKLIGCLLNVKRGLFGGCDADDPHAARRPGLAGMCSVTHLLAPHENLPLAASASRPDPRPKSVCRCVSAEESAHGMCEGP